MNTPDERLIQVTPAPRQVALQEMEFYAFVHFTVNTFTDREWGDGTEDPSIFNPAKLDAEQWVRALKDAGMKGLILTCKHHDGFCLWPSKYTRHSVASSPYKGGRGDVVGEVAEACRRGGLKFGVYLSPWDRNQPLYGTGKPYDDYFVNQLTELLTNYGEIFDVWFDGACGEGPNGKKQYYDWERYYATIRALQPGACISVCGPDVRWCGNEAGDPRPSEWSVVPRRMMDTERIASSSQQTDDAAFRQKKLTAQMQDLGSREALADEPELIWYPAEVNTSIRPGWFWHESEDAQVRPLAELMDIYEKSVGGNATMLLNVPPDRNGLFRPQDVRRLQEIGAYLRRTYGHNLLTEGGTLTAVPAGLPGHEAARLCTEDESYYQPAAEALPVEITVQLDRHAALHRLVLREQLRLSQRVESFAVDAWVQDGWQQVTEGTVIGNKKIVPLPDVITDRLRVRILDSRGVPALRFLGVYAAE